MPETKQDLVGESTPLVDFPSTETGSLSSSLSSSPCSPEAASLIENKHHGNATQLQSYISISKVCFGTGALALPFAAQQGGVILYVSGTIAIGFWNVIAVKRLCQCFEILVRPHQHDHPIAKPPDGTATMSKVAWYALGPRGLILMDVAMVFLLLAINVAYQDAVRSFLSNTPFTTRSDIIDSLIVASAMASLSVVPDLGYLAGASAAGLVVLFFAFLVISGYGVSANEPTPLLQSVGWFPQGLSGISDWFGCSCFGFGIVPLTFNFRDSMAQPDRLVPVATFSLLSVAGIYILIGLVLSLYYPHITGDVLYELPAEGILPAITRLAMSAMVVATAPLLIVPCSELLEGKLEQFLARRADHVPSPEVQGGIATSTKLIRFGICFVGVIISVGIPDFVRALSFVGSFCVATVSFVVPLLLHIMLQWNHGIPRHSGLIPFLRVFWLDLLLLAWGIFATIFSTMYTLQKGGNERQDENT